MEQLTLGQIAIGLAFLAGILTSIGVLTKRLKEWVGSALKDQLDAIKKEIDGVSKKVDTVDIESSKNYLVTFLAKVESGAQIDEIERERFYEQFEHYKEIGGNSYIKRKVEQLEAQKLL